MQLMEGIRIVVAGEAKTGKSSLIVTTAAEIFPADVPPVLPPTRLPEDMFPDRVPVTIIDTSSSIQNRDKLFEELKKADVIILTYACDRPETLAKLSTYWLPELRRLEVKVPIIVVGCMMDKMEPSDDFTLEQVMLPIMQQYREIETCIECSASKQTQVVDAFYYAQKAVLHPTSPLFDLETLTLRPRCVRALKRIFTLLDNDKDGALSDEEMNDFQVRCFNAPLQPSEIVDVKRVVQEKVPEGVNDKGLTLTGFLFLQALFIEKGRLETTWAVLRKFGYNNEMRLTNNQLLPPMKKNLDQSVELANEAVEFLKRIFDTFVSDVDGTLRAPEVENLFSTAPENPWNEAPYEDAAEKNVSGGLTLNGFLSLWALMALLDPRHCVENLIYIGYKDSPASAIRITRRRKLDRKKKQSDRNVYHCFVFGPKEAGKTAIMDSFIHRPFAEEYAPTISHRYAVNIVEQPGGSKKTLVLHEIPEDEVEMLLQNKDALVACDVAVFVYDRSSEVSWKKASELLFDVASHGENTGYEVPCLIFAAKDDLKPYSTEIQDSKRVSQELGVDVPIPISTKMGDDGHIYHKIVSAAEQPHLSIPETPAGRIRKQYQQLISRSLIFLSVGAAVGVVGLAAYRIYASRKNASG